MTTARQVSLDVTYESTDITEDLRPYVKSWTYTDNLSGQADELQITLMDKNLLWQGDWFPDRGAKISATIKRKNWQDDDKNESLEIGGMEIDEIDVGHPPSEVTIKALSVPQSSALKGENKNKAWEKTKLSVVAADIAADDGVELVYKVDDDPEYDRVEETEETDLHFIMRLCRDAGLAWKVTDSQLVILDEAKFEQADPVMTIDRTTFPIKQYRGRATLHDTYKACRLKYRSPKGRKNYDYTFTPDDPPNTERVLVLRERFDSLAEAERKAKKALREKNSQAWQFSLTILAFFALYAGDVITLKNFGKFDGNWLITQVARNNGNGHETGFQMRRCLEGY